MASHPQPLASLYQYFYERNKNHVTSCVVTAAKLDRKITKSDVLPSLERLISMRQPLRWNVFDGVAKEVPYDINTLVDEQNAEDLASAINTIHETVRFDTDVESLLWKIVIVNGETIVFATDHLFCDGTTAILVIEDLITLMLGNGNITSEADSKHEYESLITPTFSTILGTVLSEFKKLFGSFFHKDKLPSSTTTTTTSTHDTVTSNPHGHIMLLHESQFDKIRLFTRREGITFTNFLCIINVLAISKVAGLSTVNCKIPVNQRKFMNDPRFYGNAISVIDLSFSTMANWDELKKKSRITTKELRESAQIIGMLRYIDIKGFVEQGLATSVPRKDMCEVSNLGLRPQLDGVEYFVFSQSTNRTSMFVVNSVVGTKDCVAIQMSYPFDPVFFDAYKNELTRLIDAVLQSGGSLSGESLLCEVGSNGLKV